MHKLMCPKTENDKICPNCQCIAIYSPIEYKIVKLNGDCWHYCPKCGTKLKDWNNDINESRKINLKKGN